MAGAAAQPSIVSESSIGVYARVRPLLDPRTASLKAVEGIDIQSDAPSQILLRNLEFSLDHCFGPEASQREVYDVVARERVARVMDGVPVCLLAYGQTGSGKTHTVFVRPPAASI